MNSDFFYCLFIKRSKSKLANKLHMVSICLFMILDYFFLKNYFDLFFFLRNLRFMSYNLYSAWVHCYEILGIETIAIPACVKNRIHGEFILSKNNNTGFKELRIKILRSSFPEMFCKKDDHKNLIKFIRKHPCWSFFLTKLQVVGW